MKPQIYFFASAVTVLATMFAPAGVQADDNLGTIYPTSVSMLDAEGSPAIFAPYRVYTEYQFGTSESAAGLADVVDYHGHRVRVGADFIARGPWLFGLALSYSDTHDNGSSPFATIETDKAAKGISLYVAKPVHPNVAVGGSVFYENVSGQSVYNGFDVNNETSSHYGASGFLSFSMPLTEKLGLEIRPELKFTRGAFNYDLNIPPFSSIERTSLHLPATLSYAVTDAFSVSGTATLNYTLDEETFANVPQASDVTLTVEAGASYSFGNGTSVYGAVNHVLFDSNYDSTSLRAGLSYSF